MDTYLGILKLTTEIANLPSDKNRICNMNCPHYKFYSKEHKKVFDKTPYAPVGYHFCSKYKVLLERAISGTNYSNPVKNCGGKVDYNFYEENNPFLVKRNIEEKLKKINKIKIEIDELVKEKYPDYNFELELAHGNILWECEESPIGTCLYNKFEDKSHNNCIFCHEPEERK